MPETVNLAQVRPSEVALSPDGNFLYSSGGDGILRVYDVRTGTLAHSWQIGGNLGGLDISPDGNFVMVVDRNIAARVYKVDVATGTKTAYDYPPSDGGTGFFDVAVLSNGTALLTQNYSGSGWVTLKILNLATGQFTVGASVNQSSVLSRTETGSSVLIGQPNSSGGPLAIYQTGTGIVANTGANGYNWGIQAYASNGGMVAQYIYNEGINIYDGALHRQLILTGWANGRVTDLAFDKSGQNLFVLDNQANAIVQIRVSDWTTVATVPVGTNVGGWMGQLGATSGNRLILDADGRYFSVVTDTGLLLVQNPAAAALVGTNGADHLDGTLFADNLQGGAGDDHLMGYGGNDSLIGDAGQDVLAGGTGDDSYLVDGGDTVIEAVGEGRDTVYATASFTLTAGAEVEVLTVYDRTSTDAITLSGNAFGQTIYGNMGANGLIGGGGSDILYGLGGNDSYIVDDASDQVIEFAGQGWDTVYALGSYALQAGSEVEVLTVYDRASTMTINLTGNASNNILYGNMGANTLIGGGGSDILYGLGGDDAYIVDDASDQVIEFAGQGRDTVYAIGSYALASDTEVEVLSAYDRGGTTAITLAGSATDNVIYGNMGANGLIGGGGADTLYGLGGDDSYIVDSLDSVIEFAGQGRDTVYALGDFTLAAGSEVEVVTAYDRDAATALKLTGNALANTIIGDAGANVLDGKGGADVLYGLGGADKFQFSSALTPGMAPTVIGDFVTGVDKIALDDAIFSKVLWDGLGAMFVTGTAAADADDRLIYDTATGALWYDPDGTGAAAAIQFATLQGHPTLTAGDFWIV